MSKCVICQENLTTSTYGLFCKKEITFNFDTTNNQVIEIIKKTLSCDCNSETLHLFHEKCITNLTSQQCPLCRTDFNLFKKLNSNSFKKQNTENPNKEEKTLTENEKKPEIIRQSYKINRLCLDKLEEIINYFIQQNQTDTAETIFQNFSKTHYLKDVSYYENSIKKIKVKDNFIPPLTNFSIFEEDFEKNPLHTIIRTCYGFIQPYLFSIIFPFCIVDLFSSAVKCIKLSSDKKTLKYLNIKKLIDGISTKKDVSNIKKIDALINWEKTKSKINFHYMIIYAINILFLSCFIISILAKKYNKPLLWIPLSILTLPLSPILMTYYTANTFEYIKQKEIALRKINQLK
ncbi:MAG: hypothetical protein AMS24_01315 [Chlamydiae bacterium SM23_39]|nr:MAG: hypothetical protein AMS24_01315 [Chlamydiae bacterium SM23_39]